MNISNNNSLFFLVIVIFMLLLIFIAYPPFCFYIDFYLINSLLVEKKGKSEYLSVNW